MTTIGNVQYGQITLGASTTQISDKAFKTLAIKNHVGNDSIHIGDSTVSAADGYEILGGESLYINELLAPGFLYAIGTATQKVSFFGITYGDRD